MIRLGTKNDVTYYLTQYEADSEALKEFFKLRYAVFSQGEANHYSAEPDRFDKDPSTLFIVAVERKGEHQKVIGGRRLLVHYPDSHYRLNAELSARTDMQHMLPHLKTEGLCYAEMGSMCLDPAYRGEGYAKQMYDYTFRMAQFLDTAFLIVQSVPGALLKLQKRCENAGAKQVVLRRDLPDRDGDETSFISFRSEDDMPLLSHEMKKAGIGKPASEIDITRIYGKRAPVHAQDQEREFHVAH